MTSEAGRRHETDDEWMRENVAGSMPASLADLASLIRIPSVSWPTFDPQNVADSAAAVRRLALGTGLFETVEIRRAPVAPPAGSPAGGAGRDRAEGEPQGGGPQEPELGQPAVVARRPARNGRPTILLYAHHDVQPEGAEGDWESAPFEPVVVGDRLYGRGAADDKAGIMVHIAALRALAARFGDDLELGLVLYVEGEEEFGSRSFAAFLRENRELLAADAMVVADSDNWDARTPALTVALRGNVTFTLGVRTLAHASHSGMFGGAVPDAMLAMTRLITSLYDEDGSVAVAGLTTHEAPVPDYPVDDLRRDAAFLPGVAPIGTGPVRSRLWFQPAISITGIDAPSLATASNTLLPTVSVRVSCRVAPSQPAREAFEALARHLEDHAPFGAEVTISGVDLGEAFLADTDGWASLEMRRAMEFAWGRPPMLTGTGGSIPFIAELVREFPAAQILVTGVEDPDTRAHSPNESLHLGVFRRAATTEAVFLARAAARPAGRI
ncbi:MAG TPA: M20/M25/M40 family metallo-hydrolase [Microbacteriaceae bacterium]|nr:M20/M25/M40 family metallo-hydrolase [Microbacteriaceae bacterium]